MIKFRPDAAGPLVGWLLAAAALIVGYVNYGWRGLVMAASVIVFWLLLQLNRALRTLRKAAASPVGSVPSAVMLNARLKAGMKLAQVIGLTGSLGSRMPTTAEDGETWQWRDAGGVQSVLTFRAGRLQHWELRRPEDAA